MDSINAQDKGADWRYVIPSQIPLGSDEIAVGIIYDAGKIALKVIRLKYLDFFFVPRDGTQHV